MNTRQRVAAAGLTAAVTLIAGFEGLRLVAYRDPVGIPTICFGYTPGVRMGDEKTLEECKDLLGAEVLVAYESVDRCVHVPLTPGQLTAFTSFTYNVGGSAFCRSTLVRKLNARDYAGACRELDRWVNARGVRLPGLVKRRAEERRLCEQGMSANARVRLATWRT